MPLPGGASDKAGNRYELYWTVQCLAEILADGANSMRLEPPGEEGKGVEFWLSRDGLKEYHQVKRQQARGGSWSLPDLAGVLRNFRLHLLAGPASRCVFVSTQAAPVLTELADRASRSVSVQEFQAEFLKSNSAAQGYGELRTIWNICDHESAWALLRRIEPRTMDERAVKDLVVSRLGPIVTGNPEVVADILAQYALESVHQILDGNRIWGHLESRGYRPTNWGVDASVAAAIREYTRQYLSGEITPIPRIEREEADQIVSAFTADATPQRIVFLTGEAGSGKSGIAAQVVEQLRAREWPVLAFRLDRVEAVSKPEQLATSLGLTGSPAAVLAAVALGGDCLLVVDQLDAVSTVSGRNPNFFHCFAALLRETSAHSKLKVLIICRNFDLEHDHRLRRLRSLNQTAPVIQVKRLTAEAVKMTVNALGFDSAHMTDRQIELLSLPLHLSLLAEAQSIYQKKILQFDTVVELFNNFWDRKRQDFSIRMGQAAGWHPAIDRLCSLMSAQQILSISADSVLDIEDDCANLVSEHVLRRDANRIAFFHESFFDYAFARIFVGRQDRISHLVLSTEQYLFRRAQIRQVLLYKRASGDMAGFLGDLRWLLDAKDVRFHLRHTAILVLAGLPDPRDQEWDLVQQVMGHADPTLASWARRVVIGTPGWLRLLQDNGTLQQWLACDGPDHHTALGVLRRWAIEEPERSAALIEPWMNGDEARRHQVWDILAWHDGTLRSNHVWDVICRLMETSEPPRHVMHRWAKTAPERCCEALAVRLRRLLAVDPQQFAESSGDQNFPYEEAASLAPAAFLANMQAVALLLVESLPPRWGRDCLPRRDGFHWHGGADHRESARFFNATSRALARVADADETAFREHFRAISQTDSLTLHIVALQAVAQASPTVAPVAADYLLTIFDRYKVGEDEYLTWPIRDAIAAMSPHWDGQVVADVAARILRVRPKWEHDIPGYKVRGRVQRLLLEALPASHLPPESRRRLEEWRRKLGTEAGERPGSHRGGVVESPVPAKAIEHMSDRQWLSAIHRYRDDTDRIWLKDRILGGAWEFSRHLELRTKEQPKRFAELCLQFTHDTHLNYIDAVLMGVTAADLEIDTDLVVYLLRRAHATVGQPSGRCIARLVQRYAVCALPAEILALVCWYGLQDSDPQEEMSQVTAGSGGKYYGGDLYLHGINTTRGAVAETLASLIFADPDRADDLRTICEHLIRDRIMAVRSCAAHICTALLVPTPTYAVSQFQVLIECDEALLATRPVENFLSYALWQHFTELRPTLERMMASSDEAIAQAGARQACLAAFEVQAALPLAEMSWRGHAALRRGAAEIYSHNLISGPDRSTCEAALTVLFHDEDETVRRKAVGFLYYNSLKDHIRELEPLLHKLLNSPAFCEADDRLFHVLDEAIDPVVDLLFAAVERFLATSAQAAADGRTRSAATAKDVSDLLIRVYAQAQDDKLRTRSLDLIDNLIAHEAYGIEQVMDELAR